MIKNPFVIFVLGTLIMASIFFLIPINFFDGEVHYNTGLQQFTESTKLALSYFIGIGIKEGDLKDVVSFNLTPAGYALAVIFIVGIPGLIAYRMTMKKEKK